MHSSRYLIFLPHSGVKSLLSSPPPSLEESTKLVPELLHLFLLFMGNVIKAYQTPSVMFVMGPLTLAPITGSIAILAIWQTKKS